MSVLGGGLGAGIAAGVTAAAGGFVWAGGVAGSPDDAQAARIAATSAAPCTVMAA